MPLPDPVIMRTEEWGICCTRWRLFRLPEAYKYYSWCKIHTAFRIIFIRDFPGAPTQTGLVAEFFGYAEATKHLFDLVHFSNIFGNKQWKRIKMSLTDLPREVQRADYNQESTENWLPFTFSNHNKWNHSLLPSLPEEMQWKYNKTCNR